MRVGKGRGQGGEESRTEALGGGVESSRAGGMRFPPLPPPRSARSGGGGDGVAMPDDSTPEAPPSPAAADVRIADTPDANDVSPSPSPSKGGVADPPSPEEALVHASYKEIARRFALLGWGAFGELTWLTRLRPPAAPLPESPPDASPLTSANLN